jgi:hypothetical protein
VGTNTVSRAPGQRRQSTPWRGRGFLALEKPANPAAGAGFNYVVDGTYWRRLLALTFTFVTSVTGADRVINLQILDGDGFVINQQGIIDLQTANQATNVSLDQAPASGNENPQGIRIDGTVTSPTAGQNICSVSGLPNGSYQLEWTVELSGTLTAGTDNDNFKVAANGADVAQSSNLAVAGTYPQEPVDFTQETGANVSIQAIAAGTVGAVYQASVVINVLGSIISEGQIPDLTLKSGWQINLQGINLQAADQISAIGLLFERFPSSDYQEGDDSPADQLASLILDIASGV